MSPRRLEAFAGDLRCETRGASDSFGCAVVSLLRHRADTADHIEAALAADPQMAGAHLLRGFALRILGRRDLLPGVTASLQAAEETFLQRGAEPRERALYESLKSWCEGESPRAAQRLDDELRKNPHDLLMIKLAHALRFMMGDNQGMRRSVEAVLPFLDDSNPGLGFVLGCHAFALEETRDYEAAEKTGRKALEYDSHDVWALHAVAHVFYEQKRAAEGLVWLSDRDEVLEGVNNFAGHIAWHNALFQVDSGSPRAALSLYDRRIAIYPPRDYRDVSNAVSLLLLLEGRGFDLRARWMTLAELARERLGDHGLAFADVHYVMALTGSGLLDDAREFLASMKRAAKGRAGEFESTVSQEVGVPIAEVAITARSGDTEKAHRMVEKIRARIIRMGGSHAQRRVVDWLLEAETSDSGFRSLAASVDRRR